MPVGPYEDFAACVAANQDKEDPEAYCAAIENAQRGANQVTEALNALKALLEKDPKGQRLHFAATVKQVDEEDFEADIVASTANIDRDREVVMPEGMVVPKPRRVPLVSSHQYMDLRKQIGDVPRVKVNGEISARPRWFVGMGNAEADWAFALVKMGVAAFSIGFLPLEWEDADLSDEKTVEQILAGKKPLRRYTKWELAEISQVIVPSNRGAVQRMVEAGILPKDFKAEGLSEDPMEEAAQKAFDAALKSWQERQETQATVKDEPKPVPPAAGPEHQCPEGFEWDNERNDCVKIDHPEVGPETLAEPETASFDLMKLFEAAGKKETDEKQEGGWRVGGSRDLPMSDDEGWDAGAAEDSMGDPAEDGKANWKALHIIYRPDAADQKGGYKFPFGRVSGGRKVASRSGLQAARQRLGQADVSQEVKAAIARFINSYLGAPEERAQVVVTIKFDEDIRPGVEKMLGEFKLEVAEMLKQSEAKVNGAVESAIAAKFGPDSAAYTKTTDLIKAVMTGVKEHVDRAIALAKGNVDAWLS